MSSILQSLKVEKSNQQEIVECDFYIENGLYVFTEVFHLKRGKCCKSGCRHCPYGYDKIENLKKRIL